MYQPDTRINDRTQMVPQEHQEHRVLGHDLEEKGLHNASSPDPTRMDGLTIKLKIHASAAGPDSPRGGVTGEGASLLFSSSIVKGAIRWCHHLCYIYGGILNKLQ